MNDGQETTQTKMYNSKPPRTSGSVFLTLLLVFLFLYSILLSPFTSLSPHIDLFFYSRVSLILVTFGFFLNLWTFVRHFFIYSFCIFISFFSFLLSTKVGRQVRHAVRVSPTRRIFLRIIYSFLPFLLDT